jgi:transcription-repair coupling factor (superfamily II helicase)
MWLACPKQNAKLGEEFYDHKFQPLLKVLQKQAEDRLEVVQKDDRVRFVISEIPDLKAAANFLKAIQINQPEEEKALV